nr:hypothetical protein [Gammaproteobacteria bacterium]
MRNITAEIEALLGQNSTAKTSALLEQNNTTKPNLQALNDTVFSSLSDKIDTTLSPEFEKLGELSGEEKEKLAHRYYKLQLYLSQLEFLQKSDKQDLPMPQLLLDGNILTSLFKDSDPTVSMSISRSSTASDSPMPVADAKSTTEQPQSPLPQVWEFELTCEEFVDVQQALKGELQKRGFNYLEKNNSDASLKFSLPVEVAEALNLSKDK